MLHRLSIVYIIFLVASSSKNTTKHASFSSQLDAWRCRDALRTHCWTLAQSKHPEMCPGLICRSLDKIFLILRIGVANCTEEKDVLKLYSNMIEKMSKGLTRPIAANCCSNCIAWAFCDPKTEDALWDFRLTCKRFREQHSQLDLEAGIARAGFSVFGSAARGTFLGALGFGVSSAVAWV